MNLGICSSPTVDGDRVYVVTNRCEVVCLDVHGMANGNDGPFRDEGHFTAGWGKPPIPPGPPTPTSSGVTTSSATGRLAARRLEQLAAGPRRSGLRGHRQRRRQGEKCPIPHAPSLIVLDKRTGRLVAQDDEKIGTPLFHGQWSSPSLGNVGGRRWCSSAAATACATPSRPCAVPERS